jgi:dienelactone hydrolase
LEDVTRRDIFRAAAFAPLLRPLFAQTNYPGVAYREYARCLPDYLRGLAARAYELRNREIAKLTTPEAVRRRQAWARETFWKLVGGMPERTPLNLRTMGGYERQGYRVEKLVYESQPRFHIPANLYIPTGAKPPFPGVLFQMGHSLNGKAAEPYQKCCQALARLGYLVLAFDPMGQGERTYYPDEKGYLTRLRSADAEHTVPGRQMILLGDTSTRLQTWDAVRSLDVLASHPLVDPKRLASTGQSGGGTLTMLLAAVDDRLSAAAVSCGNTENIACANFNPPGSTDDAEQNLLGGGPLGFDRWDLLYPLAPKPLLVLVSAKDFFGTYSPRYIANGWEEFQKLRKVYETLGAADRLKWVDTPLPHGLSYYPRLEIYRWFARWMKSEDRAVREEPPVRPEKDETLFVDPKGNVVRSFSSETPFSLNKAHAAAVRTPEQPQGLEELLGLERPRPGARFTVLSRVPLGRCEVEAVEVPSAPDVWIPAWLFHPARPDPSKPVLLILEPQGRNGRWQEDALYDSLANGGRLVCAPDLRGIGDLSPELGRGAPRHGLPHNSEENYAWSSLVLGRSLLGQRVTDILALVEALASRLSAGQRIVIAAMGKMTVPALFATALEPRIEKAYLAGGLVSYRSIVENEAYSHPFANFVPGLLLRTDLPELAASLAPRKVILAGPVDGANRPLPANLAQAVYRRASNVDVLPETGWTEARLSDL